MLAIVCPGQGSQTPGFLTPWLEVDGVRDQLVRLSESTGIDLVAHGTTSDAETIKDTAIAQPLIVGAGLVSLPPLLGDAVVTLDGVGLVAGHSVGEITASAAAGVLDAGDAVVFVRERGRAMAAASAATPTGMAAVLGGDPDDVLATLERHGLTPANVNGAGQTVAAGTLEQLEALQADPPAKARVIPLQVAGAFHTHHMAPAVSVLEELAETTQTRSPSVTLLSNADGRPVTDGRETLDRLVRQVSNPVRWDLCMESMLELGVTGLIELPPAGALVGLAKRAMKGVETLALKTPDDLEAARRMISAHAGTTTTQAASPSARVDEE
ncbi:MAG TPA: ACP S-malonyltransferase [Intrasporangium sp.]|uniref:ACP S-malonyltransferase n=1 Tax=Intrasporangium sp. TaxID=1925024 RepID=UPI002B499C71|nr:ACP S-malonyltransferase [Intrasporangium sp.]HKX66447.1 ACP S-malonyltransferase [Intrasporangium sp.]